ncbi:hypothetical protein LSH36_13g17012 [Paralvinella palmiformis]|uniref:Uncharacterized protein n=1 Tax=Paralvinella palmiformis TaxID=53620 RepID=A0AAD9NJ03_9ANNE|nr:hypothetical protein LSH36_13g17012 [Paralvinella palmiformis]
MANFPVTVVLAILVAELVSWLYYGFVANLALGAGDRYFPTGILCNIPVCIILRHIISEHFPVTKFQQAVKVSFMLTLFLSCMAAPSIVNNVSTLTIFLVHAFHRVIMLFSIIVTYMFTENIKAN